MGSHKRTAKQATVGDCLEQIANTLAPMLKILESLDQRTRLTDNAGVDSFIKVLEAMLERLEHIEKRLEEGRTTAPRLTKYYL